MTWLSYLNGSLYISVEISGFTGTETRGQLNLQLSYRLWVRLVFLLAALAMFNYDETRTLGTINVPALVLRRFRHSHSPSASAHESGITSSRTRYLARVGLMEQNLQFAEAVSTFSAACL